MKNAAPWKPRTFRELSAGLPDVPIEGDARSIIAVIGMARDSHGSLVYPSGCEITNLPRPLLHAHHLDEPLGAVTHATITKAGLHLRAVFASPADPAAKRRIDRIWKSVLSGELACVSGAYDVLPGGGEPNGYGPYGKGWNARRWTLRELSICRQGANPTARITVVTGTEAQVQRVIDQARHEHATRPKDYAKVVRL
ncbi:HK97 family phage prohead protease [Paraburkholderia saeva]|uniref:Phage prohead protein n=1 Tax=Paraburkholderia saeva TaxID=2777537 RepID=A0A9N8RY69_9BURK|nr:hypothetical protein [Paraburkholderia saeva]CAG4905759.1 hypothetical protein LMG31841_03484 [Paraburkholderia saeva]